MKHYKPLSIALTGPYGIYESLDAMRLPKMSKGDSNIPLHYVDTGIIGPKDAGLARRLILAGDDHAKAMRGIDVHFKMELQTGFMIEFETYRWGAECLSTSSTMHNELKEMRGSELADLKQAGLPDKIYVRRIKLSYQTLRRMYLARRNHGHPDWHIVCDVIEKLPFFDKLIVPEYGELSRRLPCE
jgi:hypothetical protein